MKRADGDEPDQHEDRAADARNSVALHRPTAGPATAPRTVVTIGAGAVFGMIGLTLAAPLTSAAVHISNDLRGRSSDDPDLRVVEPVPSG